MADHAGRSRALSLPPSGPLLIRCIALASAAMLIYACVDGTAPEFPAGAVRLTPPTQYHLWWEVTKTCSALSGNMSDVAWYVVPGATTIDSRGTAARWYQEGNRIVVAGRYVHEGALVRHEMLHALSKQGHTARLFRDDCGGFVECVGQCALDVGTAPQTPAGSPTVPPESLDVRVVAYQQPYSDSAGGGWIVVVVTATNSASEARWVQLTGSSPHPDTFGFTLTNALGVQSIASTNPIGFAAHETQREAFDVYIRPPDSSLALPSGSYELRGRFNSNVTAPSVFVVP